MIKQFKSLPTYEVKVYLSGPIEVAKHIIRRECMNEGLCVTVTPTSFIYTGGEEYGYVVGFLQYPRFPKDEDAIFEKAVEIAKILLEETFQNSVLVVGKDTTLWLSKRDN